ncbi:hypothetical protein [Natrinema altunense]|uniref:Uncharacterized protein n=1 Tax=Natrinema altunense TaxID=222984 RepID=A0A482XYL0_9EURY|nr:hypothetical protein [Natrinema altunense]RZH68859.1 hypothetical protein ELS17_05215 [Natrinema altunense]
MALHSRRQILSSVSVTLPLVLAGCSNRKDNTVKTQLDQLQIINYNDEWYVISILVSENNKAVYEDTVEVPPAEDDSTELGDNNWSGIKLKHYPTDPGSYCIHSWRSDQSLENAVTIDLAKYDQECAQVRINIGEAREDSGSALSIWRSFDCSTTT